MRKHILNPAEMAKWLRYEPDTGHLFWLPVTPDMMRPTAYRTAEWLARQRNSLCSGKLAGTQNPNGYVIVQIAQMGGVCGHRIAWCLAYGEDAPERIDHINGDRQDNRLVNLRLASHAQNLQNQKTQVGRQFKGISRAYKTNWGARIKVGGKTLALGYHRTAEDAARAYDRAAVEHFGAFAHLNFPPEPVSR